MENLRKQWNDACDAFTRLLKSRGDDSEMEFSSLLKGYVKEIEDFDRRTGGREKPQWCVDLIKDKYGFNI